MSLKLGGTNRLAEIVCCASANKKALRSGKGVQKVDTVGTNRCRRECSGVPSFCISIWSYAQMNEWVTKCKTMPSQVTEIDRCSHICWHAHWSISQYQTWALHSAPWSVWARPFRLRSAQPPVQPRHTEQTKSATSALWIQWGRHVCGIAIGSWSTRSQLGAGHVFSAEECHSLCRLKSLAMLEEF